MEFDRADIPESAPEHPRKMSHHALRLESSRDPDGLIPLFSGPSYSPERALRGIAYFATPWESENLGEEYEQQVTPKAIPQTLFQHTSRMMGELDKYWDDREDIDGYRFMAALHDAGKAAAMRLSRRAEQASFTLKVWDLNRERMPLSDDMFRRMKTMIETDPLGPYMRRDRRRVGLITTGEAVASAAHAAGMTPSDYLKALTPYYQADAASYTIDAGINHPPFQGLFAEESPDIVAQGRGFQFDKDRGRLVFGPASEERYRELEDAIKPYPDN